MLRFSTGSFSAVGLGRFVAAAVGAAVGVFRFGPSVGGTSVGLAASVSSGPTTAPKVLWARADAAGPVRILQPILTIPTTINSAAMRSFKGIKARLLYLPVL